MSSLKNRQLGSQRCNGLNDPEPTRVVGDASQKPAQHAAAVNHMPLYKQSVQHAAEPEGPMKAILQQAALHESLLHRKSKRLEAVPSWVIPTSDPCMQYQPMKFEASAAIENSVYHPEAFYETSVYVDPVSSSPTTYESQPTTTVLPTSTNVEQQSRRCINSHCANCKGSEHAN